jgi:hypothetical protein
MRPWRRRGLLAAGLALLATSLTAASAAATATGSTATTSASAGAPEAAAVEIQPSIKDLLASHSGPVDTSQCVTAFSVACYEPSQIETAYDEGPLFKRGVTGRDQTIAIIDAYGSPTIAADLAAFDSSFGLPAPPSFRIIQPAGAVPAFDPQNTTMISWASETTLDVEWAHVMAPGANILLVETPVAETEGTTGFPQIVQAENYVIDHRLAGIISQSFSATEQTLPRGLRSVIPLRSSFINAYYRGVTVLASTGDDGATEPLNSAGTVLSNTPVTTWPASDPLVTGVGGTQLHLSATTGVRTAPDSVWNDGNDTKLDQEFFGNNGPDAAASGGGVSVDFARPQYQSRVASVVGRARGVPDVSMSAACNGAVEVYESFPGIGKGWYLSCGTSESTPLFAGIVALADQMAHRTLGLINPAMYKLAAHHAPGISDITSGNNSVSFYSGKTLVKVPGYAARPGYDLASGVGTVDAANFVPELVRAATHHPPDHDHGPPPCPSYGHHDETASNGHGNDWCCADSNGHGEDWCCSDSNGHGNDSCWPDSNGHGNDWCCPDTGATVSGYDHCTDSDENGGWSGQGDPGQPVGTAVGISQAASGSTQPARPITTGPVAAGAQAVAPAGGAPATATTSPAAASSSSALLAAAGATGPEAPTSSGAQPSTSTSTSTQVASSSGGGVATAPGGYATLVAPSGVFLGPPEKVRQVARGVAPGPTG